MISYKFNNLNTINLQPMANAIADRHMAKVEVFLAECVANGVRPETHTHDIYDAPDFHPDRIGDTIHFVIPTADLADGKLMPLTEAIQRYPYRRIWEEITRTIGNK